MSLALQVGDRKQVLHAAYLLDVAISTSSTPSCSSRRTFTRSEREVGRFLPT